MGVEIYGSINMKIVLHDSVGTRSLNIEEGCQDKGLKTAPQAGAWGLRCYTQRAGDTPRHAISMTSRTQSED